MSNIINGLINGTISLTQSLDRLLAIAVKIEDYETANWAEHEKNGYSESDTVPSYRYIRINKEGLFPIIIGVVNLNSIYSAFKNGDTLQCPLLSESVISAAEIIKQENICNPCLHIEKILESIKTEFIKRVSKLEKTFGSLDDYDITDSKPKEYDYKNIADKVIENIMKDKNMININITNNGNGKFSNFGNNTNKNKTTSNDIDIQTAFNNGEKQSWFKKFINLFRRKKK